MIDQDEVTPESLRASAARIRESAYRANSMSEQRQELELAAKLEKRAAILEQAKTDGVKHD